jgi:Arc/MetJ-type ribon-helix-helix transcriptional regulator
MILPTLSRETRRIVSVSMTPEEVAHVDAFVAGSPEYASRNQFIRECIAATIGLPD